MKSDMGELSEQEWDFRPLIHKRPRSKQRSELHAAIIHEYARESDSIRELAAEYAALPEAVRREVEEQADQFSHSATIYGPISDKLARFGLVRFWNCVFWPDYFPYTPWLDIPGALSPSQ